MAVQLIQRDITTADGATVNGAAVSFGKSVKQVVATFVVTTSGSPTTYDMRAALEASVDGGTNWYQMARFADITNAVTNNRLVRAMGATAGAESAQGVSNLASAQTSPGTVVDAPWPVMIRCVSKLSALTGGASPHVLATVTIEVGG
jgi:hypothetical protein